MLNRRGQIIGVVAILAVAFLTTMDQAADAGNPPVFERDVRPILKTYCFHCHGEGDKLNAGLDLRLRRFMVNKETDDGFVLVPGRPDQSLILKLVRSGEMPKGEKKLTEQQIALLEAWIATGAQTIREEPPELPRGFQITEEERHFWAFHRILRPQIPEAKPDGRARTVVDRFVLSKLHERGLEFAPDADRGTLIRRVYLDLIGEPPTPEAMDEFFADTGPGAYERLLDRVLELPQYGERWGRHWLDVVGYADSNGYAEADSVRQAAWHYRDYVVRSLNNDKPWDDFITEQLAGDELAQVTAADALAKAADPRVQELLTATGYLRMAPDGTGDEVADPNLARNQVMAETIKIVSSSLLGLTVGCAQCHDHRYDPLSQKDYYRFRAIFEPALDWKHWRSPAERLVSLSTAADRQKSDTIEAEARHRDEAANQLRKELLEQVFEKELAKVPDSVRGAVQLARNTAREKRTAEQISLLKQYPSADVQGALDLYDPSANKKVLAKQEEATKLRATKPVENFIMTVTEPSGKTPATFIFHRGDHEQPKDSVEPAELEIVRLAMGRSDSLPLCDPALQENHLQTSGRRLAYARWLTSGRHPLVARVLVNRFWMQHFGRGLVGSLGDFGQLGERPTHPELLDWLASQFMAGGWRLKTFHRLVMTSTVYRQAALNDSARQLDPDNRFYGRMRPRRLEAETVRDAILAVCGSLNPEQFGPAVPIARDGAGRVVVGQQKTDARGDPTIVEPIGRAAHRRSIYVEVRRSLPLTVLEAFDAPVMSPNCEMRVVSTASPQALMMLNDTFVLDQSRRFAERLARELPGNLKGQITRAWRLAFGIEPTEREQLESLVYLAEQHEAIRARRTLMAAPAKPESLKGSDQPAPAASDLQIEALASLCQALLASNRFLYVD